MLRRVLAMLGLVLVALVAIRLAVGLVASLVSAVLWILVVATLIVAALWARSTLKVHETEVRCEASLLPGGDLRPPRTRSTRPGRRRARSSWRVRRAAPAGCALARAQICA
jgi:hypothetical protein